jgi:hypothetical protein
MKGNSPDGTMRKTSDLVNEMLAEAKNAWLVAIAIGFKDDTEFVFSSQLQPVAKLNQLVQIGGSPIGLLRFERENSTIQGSFRPFEEYADQEWAKNYLAGLLENTGEIIALSQQKQAQATAY